MGYSERQSLPRALPLLLAVLTTASSIASANAGQEPAATDPQVAVVATSDAAGNDAAPEAEEPGSSSPRHRRRNPEPSVPSAQELEARGAVIGSVTVVPGDIFDPSDPAESRKLYLLTNRLHPRTRSWVIQHSLLFHSGEPFSAYRIEESERILRSQRFLYDAEIRPVSYEDNRVDLEVLTRDVWTLKLGLSVNRAGGENSTGVELQDSNFLGTGKEVTVRRHSDVDRVTSLFRYRDPNVYGSHAEIEASYADLSDGSQIRLRLKRPFISLESRWATGLELLDDDRVDPIYTLGKEVDSFRHQQQWLELWGGLSAGLTGGTSNRWLAGYTFLKDQFGTAEDHPQPLTPVTDRTLSYPWIGFQSVQNKFEETRNLDRIGRTEDLELGRQVEARLGWSSNALGADRDRAIASASLRYAWQPSDNELAQLSAYGSGRWGDNGGENIQVGTRLRYSRRNFERFLFVVSLDADATYRLDPENQLLLGGDSGLRGYPLRYEEGDRRLLLTLEQRLYTNWNPWRLARVGAALFVDAGRAWFHDRTSASDLGMLTDVGVGLRISPSRSGLGSMIHLDVAFPLNGDPSIQGLQWLVMTKESF